MNRTEKLLCSLVVEAKKLTTEERKKIPKDKFALHKDGKDKYPIEDKEHAIDALSRVSGNGTPAEKATVRRKVKEEFPSIKQKTDKNKGKKKHKTLAFHIDSIYPKVKKVSK